MQGVYLATQLHALDLHIKMTPFYWMFCTLSLVKHGRDKQGVVRADPISDAWRLTEGFEMDWEFYFEQTWEAAEN